MATKTYNELLDELEEYNTRTKLATETYEDSLGSLQEAVDVSTSAKDAAALSETKATNEANEATNQANIAANQAAEATSQANIAEGFAAEAASQANIAEGFANNAADQVSLAEGEVVKATNQANIATNATNEATNQANIATNATNEATTQANIAEGFASDAAQSVTDAASEVTKATNQANTSEAEADRAKSEADRASEVSGLDTVEDAVDYALGVSDINKQATELLSGGMVVNRLDDNGNWNVMVKIPAFTNKMVNDKLGTNWTPEEDLHPAFIGAGGVNKTHFEIAMYTASNDGAGNPVSAPYKAPYTSVNWDSAKSKCQSMGSGWDLCGNAQWAAAAIWCLMNDYQPLGNTYYGQSHAERWQSAVRQDGGIPGDASGTASILAGSGPLSWRHNNSPLGISDLVGNVWEWQDGLKISEGQVIVALEQQAVEGAWVGQAAFLDAGNKLNSSKTASASTSNDWRTTGKDVSYIENQLLQQLLIEPVTGTDVTLGRLYYSNDGDRFPLRGGNWLTGSNAGLGALYLSTGRTYANSDIGFRTCYFG